MTSLNLINSNSVVGSSVYSENTLKIQSNSSITKIAQFEKAIYSSDEILIKNLVKQNPELVFTQLSNGDLPLVAAIKAEQTSSMKVLLELGANPTQNDDQQLNAVNYALLMQDNQAVAEILHHFVSEDMNAIQNLLQSPYSLNKAKAAVTNIQKFQSDIGRVGLNSHSILFKAILQKDPSFVKSILEQPNVNISECTSSGESIFHLAVASGNKEILDLCLAHEEAKKLVNLQNKEGRTALHFAAALGHLDMMRSLCFKDAHIRLSDCNGMTPLAFLAASSDQKDPLKITKKDLFIFLSTTLLWSAKFIPLQMVSWQAYLGIMGHLLTISSVGSLMLTLRQYETWKGCFAHFLVHLITASAFPNSPQVMAALTALNIALYAKNAFSGLRSCWKNVYLGKGRAMLKAVVTYGPSVKSIADSVSSLFLLKDLSNGIISDPFTKNLFELVQRNQLCFSSREPSHLRQCLDKSWHIVQFCTSDPNSNECKDANELYGNFLKRMQFYTTNAPFFFNFNTPACQTSSDPSECNELANIFRKQCQDDLDSEKCIESEITLKKFLNIYTESACEKARTLIGCTMQDTIDTCKKLFNKALREVHPDKTQEHSTEASELAKAMRIIKECSKD